MSDAILVLSSEADRERYVSDALPWIYEAGLPYFDWLFGGKEDALDLLRSWISREDSEVFLGRVSLFLQGGKPAGGFLAMSGPELITCRKADTIALLKSSKGKERADLVARLGSVRDLFVPPGPDEWYLSKMGILEQYRGKGLGRALVREYLDAGRNAGFHRFRLDVAEGNQPAIQLYERTGFRVTQRTEGKGAQMAYLSMSFDKE